MFNRSILHSLGSTKILDSINVWKFFFINTTRERRVIFKCTKMKRFNPSVIIYFEQLFIISIKLKSLMIFFFYN